MEPKPIVELHTFRYPTDDQLLICLVYQRHHSGLYSFNSCHAMVLTRYACFALIG